MTEQETLKATEKAKLGDFATKSGVFVTVTKREGGVVSYKNSTGVLKTITEADFDKLYFPADPKAPVRKKGAPMTPEQYSKIKEKLFSPEANTAEDWHKSVDAMLAHVGGGQTGDQGNRYKQISFMLEAARRRRNPVPQGRGAWFMALVDLFEMAGAPAGVEPPTEEEILNAREPDDIRAELAAKYDQRKTAQGLSPDSVENKA